MTGTEEQVLGRFANAMRCRLQENLHRGGWNNCSLSHLLDALHHNTAEIKDAHCANDIGRVQQ